MVSENLCLYNARRKFDAFGRCYEFIIFNRTVFNPDGFERLEDFDENKCLSKSANQEEPQVHDDAANIQRARRRALKALQDHVYANPDLDCFVTLTLDQTKIDRYDYKAVIKRMNAWLCNAVQRRGLKYVIVPELHKDGAIHFHGLTNNVWRTTDSGLKSRSGGAILNIDDYKLGFSTLVHIDENREAVCRYVTKYITKDTEKIGGRYVLSGGKLLKPHVEYDRLDIAEYDGYTVEVAPGVIYKSVDLAKMSTGS